VIGLWVLLVALAVATAVGLVMRVRDGTFRPPARPRTPTATQAARTAQTAQTSRTSEVGSRTSAGTPDPAGTPGAENALRADLEAAGHKLGERATLVQFSTVFCAPCRAARHVLGNVADLVPGVAHVEIDAEANLPLARQLRIRRTPTVLVLDADGREVRRANGAPPSRDAVLATLATFLAVPPQLGGRPSPGLDRGPT
jgi:thiol-disulfide isomerase/thioredoxin